jgi:hypothetical protein
MTYFAGLPAHPLLVHAAVVFMPMVALAVAALPLFPGYRTRYASWVMAAAAGSVVFGWLVTQTGENFETALGEQNALLEQHAQLGDTTIYFTVSTLLASVLVVWVERAKSGGRSIARSLVSGISVLAVVAGVSTTIQVVRIGHSGATTVWCEDSPSCNAGS